MDDTVPPPVPDRDLLGETALLQSGSEALVAELAWRQSLTKELRYQVFCLVMNSLVLPFSILERTPSPIAFSSSDVAFVSSDCLQQVPVAEVLKLGIGFSQGFSE